MISDAAQDKSLKFAESELSEALNMSLDALSGNQYIVLAKKELDLSNKLLRTVSTVIALTTTLVNVVDNYSDNKLVTQLISDATALNDFSGIDWFNVQLLDTFLPLSVILLMHEFGHILVAKRDNFEITSPTMLPMYILPNLGLTTGIKTLPKSLASLFDFAFIGPFMGMFTSLIFLALGASLTTGADPEALKLFPTVPLGTLQLSTLGATILDFLFGGKAVVTGGSPTSAIALHPFALAGFAGFMINSLQLLPIGSTDGGRMSQAIFRRVGHRTVSGVTWFVMLVVSFFPTADVLTAAWLISSLANGDMVEPCREEVDDVGFIRYGLAFVLWSAAFLAVVPMT
uniref:Peptidase M50 domain-containing protein n=1 Tax=Cyclophora tenuis TaxID=216820 RepID=A0A7S1D232_CYCTE